ncbi:MAG: hypothetical protein AAFX79_06370 [Planctomycetota bacterium]
MIARVGRTSVVLLIGAACLACAPGCASGDGIRDFAAPPSDVMPDRVVLVKRSQGDNNANDYIDGVLLEVYLFSLEQRGESSGQPFHRAGTLRFTLFGEDGQTLSEGAFGPDELRRAERKGALGPAYFLAINFAARGLDDVRPRTDARLYMEFEPQGDAEQLARGATPIRLGPWYE